MDIPLEPEDEGVVYNPSEDTVANLVQQDLIIMALKQQLEERDLEIGRLQSEIEALKSGGNSGQPT